MARWKLINPHYLITTDHTKWEYSETDRVSGRPVRKQFEVPRYLDPRDPSDWTTRWGNKDNQEGEIIVCFPGKGDKGDVEFLGDPTPEMIPVDDEAKSISATFTDQWRYKPDLEVGTYSQSLVDQFQSQMAEAESKPASVQVEGLADLVAAMSAQTKAVTELLSAQSHRRV
jgi:hypothetical protein